MEMFTDVCHWCEETIRRSNEKYQWRDEDAMTECFYHPIAFEPGKEGRRNAEGRLKRTGQFGPHQSIDEVHDVIRQDYLRTQALLKKEPLRSIDSNVVATPKSPRRTTRMAAEKILPKTGSIRRKVYELIRLNSGMTDFELEAELRMKHQTVSASRRSLVLDGFLIDSGRVHKNAQGNECIVWITAPIDGKLFA